ncbi:MAG: hypothetical protein HKP37_03545 [Boseongicola sp.]|nr:hypothetical protein [Boseongicola sp.]NNL17796.1 hypothetical protein [Boseongicola sp.]
MARSDESQVHYMTAVARDASDPSPRNLAMSLMRHFRSPNGHPSPKRRVIMCRPTEDLFPVEDAIVVEDCHE